MSAYTTTDIATQSVTVMNIAISAPLSSTTSTTSAQLSPTAATFVPANPRVDSAQRPLSPDATKFTSDAPTAEKPLSPKAPTFVPAAKTPKSPLSPHAPDFVPRAPMPAKRTSRSTAILLFALLDRCRRKIMQRLEVLKQLEQLPAPLRLKSG